MSGLDRGTIDSALARLNDGLARWIVLASHPDVGPEGGGGL